VADDHPQCNPPTASNKTHLGGQCLQGIRLTDETALQQAVDAVDKALRFCGYVMMGEAAVSQRWEPKLLRLYRQLTNPNRTSTYMETSPKP